MVRHHPCLAPRPVEPSSGCRCFAGHREVPRVLASAYATHSTAPLQQDHRSVKLPHRRTDIRRQHGHHLAWLCAHSLVEAFAQRRDILRRATLSDFCPHSLRRPRPHGLRRSRCRKRTLHRLFRRPAARRDVLSDQLLDAPGQLLIARCVCHAVASHDAATSFNPTPEQLRDTARLLVDSNPNAVRPTGPNTVIEGSVSGLPRRSAKLFGQEKGNWRRMG